MINFCILSQGKEEIVQGDTLSLSGDLESIVLSSNNSKGFSECGISVGDYEISRSKEILQEIYNKAEDMSMHYETTIFYEMPEK